MPSSAAGAGAGAAGVCGEQGSFSYVSVFRTYGATSKRVKSKCPLSAQKKIKKTPATNMIEQQQQQQKEHQQQKDKLLVDWRR